jgi:hypothetical protein
MSPKCLHFLKKDPATNKNKKQQTDKKYLFILYIVISCYWSFSPVFSSLATTNPKVGGSNPLGRAKKLQWVR